MPNYEWTLCHSPSFDDPFAPLEKIGTLWRATNRTFSLVKNRAGTASFQIRTNDDMAKEILDLVKFNDIRGTVRKCIKIRRDGVDLWSGPIWGIQGALDAGTLSISCVGWLERLQNDMYWANQALDYSNSGAGTPTDDIIMGLMYSINNQNSAHPLIVMPPKGIYSTVSGTPHLIPPDGSGLKEIPNGVTGVMPVRNRFYQRGQMLGAAIQDLSDIEAGVDVNVDPTTRQLQLAAWDSYRVSDGWWGAVRENVVLGYNWGPKNLKDVQWQEDPSKICNNMYVQSLGAPVGPIYDPVSQDMYGLFEELDQPSQMNQTLLIPYGVAELVIRSRPMVTWTLIPHPRMGTEGPTLFDDFKIGDQTKFSAIKDHVKIKRQNVRLFGATVTIDENDNETVTQLQLTPTSGGGA